MGMDLITEDGEGFHANWTGWSYLCRLLDHLGCDVSSLAGSNDGDLVNAEQAVAFADAIDESLDWIYDVHIVDSTMAGGTRAMPIVGTGDALCQISRVPDVEVSALRDDPDTLAWVKEFSEFCRTCGGFRQF